MKPRPRRKPRKPALSFNGVTVEELCQQFTSWANLMPKPSFTEEERKQHAARCAAKEGAEHAAQVERRLLFVPSAQQRLDQMVRFVLRYVHGELLDEPPPPPLPQSAKLYQRWALVKAGRKRGLTWPRAYEMAADLSTGQEHAGSPRVMKEAYQLVERVRRAVQHAEAEQARVGQPTPP